VVATKVDGKSQAACHLPLSSVLMLNHWVRTKLAVGEGHIILHHQGDTAFNPVILICS